jgi:hypothetical protein
MLVGYPKNATGVPMRHFPLRELGFAIGFTVLLAAIYVGSYYAMVERTEHIQGFMIGIGIPDPPTVRLKYRYGGEWSTAFYYPAHDIDRRLRPDLWRGELTHKKRDLRSVEVIVHVEESP